RHANRATPLLIADINAAPALVPPDIAAEFAPRIQSVSVFPLLVGRGCVGLLAILGTEAKEWEATTIQDLTSLIGQAAITLQNRRLLDRTQTALEIQRQQSVQLQTAAEVAAVSSSLLEVDELLNAAVNLIKERFNLYYVGMFFPDDEREFAHLRAGTGDEGQRQIELGHKLPLNNKSLIGSTISDGQPRIRQDVSQAGDWFANPHLPETQSEIALPLLVRQRVIGALSVQSRQPYAFSPELVRVLQTMSDQLAIAIDNAALFEQLQGNLEKTADLYEAARQLIAAENEREVYEVLVNFSQRTQLFERTYVFAYDAEAVNQVALLAHSGGSSHPLPSFSAPQETMLPLLTTAESHNLQMILRPTTQTQLPESLRTFLAAEKIEACALVPIYAGNTWLATLMLARQQARLPEPDELQPFQTLCNQAAVTIANQRLLHETSALYQLGRSLSAAITKEDMARATARELVNYMGIPQARVVFFKPSQSYKGLTIYFITLDETADSQQQVVSDELYEELTASRQPILLTDADPHTADERLDRYLRPFGVRAALCVPAFSQHQMLLGMVMLDSFSPAVAFTADDTNFAQVATDQFTTSVENIIFFDEALERAQQLITLNQIGARISGTLDSGELAHLVYGEVAALVPCSLFFLAEYDAVERTYNALLLESLEQDATQAEFVTHGRLQNDNPLVNLLRTGEAVILPQPETLSTAITNLYNRDPQVIPASTIFLPMHHSYQPSAFMVVQANKPFAYTAEEVNLLRAISNQTVLALANAHLLAETKENVAELRTLFNVTQSAASSVDADERVENMVNTLHNSLGEAKVELLLLDEAYQELRVANSRGFLAASPGHIYPISDDLIGQTITQKIPRLISDWSQEPNFDPQTSTRSQMCVPLTLGQRIVGVLNAESTTAGQFDDRDLRLLQTLSVSLAATIESGRLFRDIQNANEQLRELDKMKTQFLANMSHELRTPLNSIIGFSRLILKGIDGPITEMQEEDLTSIHNSGQHLLNLINDVLDLAKIDAGKMALVFDEVDLVELGQSVQSTARGLVRDDSVDLRWYVDPDLPTIEADPVRLRQIFLNLLSNAAKFTETGFISLMMKRQGDNHVQ
ncbi:MAG: GAF domain-containing protein, partial [Anaerolineales bacterium]|nr:GAF domain-containing protein [Anaerolineales bacterium]